MTKPTGRPRGRPKTKEYATLMARVDVALVDQVQRYARLHRQTISDLIRDGLAWRITDGDPLANLMSDRYTSVQEAFLSDRNESPLDTLLAETDRLALDALLSDTYHNALDDIMSDVNAGASYIPDTHGETKKGSDRHEGVAAKVSDRNGATFDPAKFTLSTKPCPRGHTYAGTGRALLRLSNKGCRDCDNEKKRQKRQQAQPPSTPSTAQEIPR